VSKNTILGFLSLEEQDLKAYPKDTSPKPDTADLKNSRLVVFRVFMGWSFIFDGSQTSMSLIPHGIPVTDLFFSSAEHSQ
jgi:hypothetical protein